MEYTNNNKTTVTVIALIIGLGIGWLMWGMSPKQEGQPTAVTSTSGHMMPDGTMMGNGVTPMASMMAQMNANLIGKTGDAFDQAFITEMVMHHEGAVQMAELALTNAKHSEIKTLANAIITAQNSEIAQMKGWQKNWYGSSQ